MPDMTDLPRQTLIPSYVYQQYSDDLNVTAFFSAYNSLGQNYLDWFNQTALPVYTNQNINGPLLDWIGQGIYGISRPVLAVLTGETRINAYNQYAYDTNAYNQNFIKKTYNFINSDDDLYKRVLTWRLYRGDGNRFNLQWLKNRVTRFLNYPNGGTGDVLSNPVSIIQSGNNFQIISQQSQIFDYLQALINNGTLPVPFQYTYSF